MNSLCGMDSGIGRVPRMSHSNENVPALARLDELDRFCRAVFLAAGTDDETADAATRAMMHGTRLGVDSHGVRLLAH